jgi:coenzyme F420-reducing hydrogenase alpha subunit
MPRRCSVCDHDDSTDINSALASNEPLRTIADRWSVSKTALIRHRNEHLPASSLLEAEEAEEAASADSLLDEVRELHEHALSTLNRVEEAEELSVAVRAIREATDDLERSAKLLEELDESPQANT